MIYSSLKIGPNGGIFTDVEKAHQDPNAVTLAIGIGGTGITALKTLKNAVYTRLIPDNADTEGEEPQYKRIKFLAIDSEQNSCDGDGYARILRSEYFGILSGNIVEALNNRHALDSDPTLQWFEHEKIHPDACNNSPNCVRQTGRFLIVKKAYELKTEIESILRTAMEGVPNPHIYIHIFAGLSGGTGSGCFIDTCYIIQQALMDNGWLDMAKIMGFFFLPDVTLNAPYFSQSWEHREHLQANGYAALKELDYLMNLRDGIDFFEQDYGNFRVHTNNPPLHECHLVSTIEFDGLTPVNAYSYAMNSVSEHVFNYLVSHDQMPLEGLLNIFWPLRNAMPKRHAANYRYNIMGASSAIIPYREIATYLATGLFKRFDYYEKNPSEGDVRNFAVITGLSFIDLERELLNGVMPPNVPDIPTAQLKASSAPLFGRLNAWYDATSGKMHENYDKLTRELPEGEWDIPLSPDSILGKVFKELIMDSRDPQKGPYYAKDMLRHDNRLAIDNVLAGVIKEVQESMQSEQIQHDLRKEEFNKAKNEFYNTGRFNPLIGMRKKKYVTESINWINHLHNMERLSILEELVTNLRLKLKRLYSNYFEQFISVLDNIKETFDENRSLFESGLHHDTGKLYIWNMVELKDIQDALDDEIKQALNIDQHGNLTAEQAMIDFMFLMTDPANVKIWMSGRETRIASLVSSFATGKFREAINRRMVTYLRQKYNADGEDLIEIVAHHVIRQGLVNNAQPAFYNDNATFNLWYDAPVRYVMSVPEWELLIGNAAEKCRDDYGMHMLIRSTDIRDRISMICFYTGVPMYAYRFLRDLEKSYKRMAHFAGFHLYEKGEINWKTYLPSPIPATCILDEYEAERLDRKRIDTIKEAYEYAQARGLIIINEDEAIELPIVEPINVDEFKARAAQSEEQRNTVIAELEMMEADFVENCTGFQRVALPSGIDPRLRDDANLDALVKFTKIGEILKNTVNTHRNINSLLQELRIVD